MTGSVPFDSQVKLVLVGVDETIAEVYCPAEKQKADKSGR
jgi:hypothetical protein